MTGRTALLAGLALAVAAPAAAQPAGAPMPPMMLQGTRLDVVADGEVTRAPDLVTIGAGVVTQAATAAEAMRDNAARMAAAVAALRKAGVADRDIQTSSISLAPQYRYGENVPPVITGYQVSNTVSVRFREVARAGAILDTLVALLARPARRRAGRGALQGGRRRAGAGRAVRRRRGAAGEADRLDQRGGRVRSSLAGADDDVDARERSGYRDSAGRAEAQRIGFGELRAVIAAK